MELKSKASESAFNLLLDILGVTGLVEAGRRVNLRLQPLKKRKRIEHPFCKE